MLRGMFLSVTLLVATLEPVLGDPDLVKYGMTQGGLLAVCLVLLWWIRKDNQRKDDRMELMTQLVADSTAALTKNSDASDRVARALENLERRHR